MKTWIKALLICVICSALVFTILGFAIFKAIPDFKSEAASPQLASSVFHSMVEIADPLPANFSYKGGVDTPIVKVAILARNEYQIVFVKPFFVQSYNLQEAIASEKGFGPLKAKDFTYDKTESMSVGDGLLEYAVGSFKKPDGQFTRGMLGLLKNRADNSLITIEAYDVDNNYDFSVTREILAHITAIK